MTPNPRENKKSTDLHRPLKPPPATARATHLRRSSHSTPAPQNGITHPPVHAHPKERPGTQPAQVRPARVRPRSSAPASRKRRTASESARPKRSAVRTARPGAAGSGGRVPAPRGGRAPCSWRWQRSPSRAAPAAPPGRRSRRRRPSAGRDP